MNQGIIELHGKLPFIKHVIARGDTKVISSAEILANGPNCEVILDDEHSEEPVRSQRTAKKRTT